MRRAVWEVEDYPLPRKGKRLGWIGYAAAGAAILAAIFALYFGGKALGLTSEKLAVLRPTIYLGIGSLFTAGVAFYCSRSDHPLLSIPAGLLSAGALLLAVGAYVDSVAEGSSWARGFVIAGGVILILMAVSYALVGIYYRWLGNPLPRWMNAKRYTPGYTMAGGIVFLILLAIGVVLTVLDDFLLWLSPALLILVPAAIVLFFVCAIISVARKGFALFAIPIGIMFLSILLIVASVPVSYLNGKSTLFYSFLAPGIVLFALMPLAVIVVNLYYHLRGKPVPTRYGHDNSPWFLIGFLIFYLVMLAFCGTMILITSNKP